MRRAWSDAAEAKLRALYATTALPRLAFLLKRTPTAIKVRAQALGLRKASNAGRFKAGQPSWSKGTKGRVGVQPACRATQFVPGVRRGVAVKLYKPIGTERISKDGYREVKVHDGLPLQSRWRAVHLVRWEAINGRIPKGHALVFRDGDKTNTDPQNMELITRRELMLRNTLHRYPQPIPQLIQLRGALNRKINKRAGREKQDGGSAQSPVRRA